ncbi:hypothetical protein [Mycolicibacterium fallax]|uniref:Uncharacterized protein n=1 Tax=Mycolicibacterium fallax TaxID=1793 RepID=A0A1X1R2Z3_MYCFA|nr:hypothetical protein [Mycolicibacterium fallax]ORU98652.1 hypothetical protein AWC04_00260 [Mycolicibacterium fallax]BBY99877.1 hypothetical protein MFAL_33440 [Mycolicibacterium fallax]
MLVADLQHFLDLGPEVPGPALKLAEHLTSIAAAASAGDAHTPWETALPCRRRPANRRCPGRIIVVCPDPDQSIGWRCSHCGDDGTISNWAGSIYDLRRQQLTAAQPRHVIIIDADTAAILRTLPLLDNHCQRAVFAIRGLNDELHLALTDIELDELIDALAAESNHEPNRRRQRQLDTAYDVLTAATDSPRW